MTLVVVNNTLIAKIDGDMDHHAAGIARHKIDMEIKNRPVKNLVFDFKELDFMDSSGIGMILGRYKLIKGLNGNVFIAQPKPNVEKIINISGLHKIIPVYDNIEKAIDQVCGVK